MIRCFLSQRLRKALSKQRFRELIEKELRATLELNENQIIIKAKDALSEHEAAQVLEALNLGFRLKDALQLKHSEYQLQQLELKARVKPSRLRAVKGRILGKEGKALTKLEELTSCRLRLVGSKLAILGKTEDVMAAIQALEALIRGKPHGRVYRMLQEAKARASEELEQLEA